MSRLRVALMVLVFLAAVGLILIAAFWPRIAAAGWLIAFVYVSAIPIGSLALLLIHRLTGGHWGNALGPLLQPIAISIAPLAVLYIPVLIALPSLFAWVAGSPEVKPDVNALYLNIPSFTIRTVVALLGWSALAFLLPRMGDRLGTLLAALGLFFHAVSISLIAVDWVLGAEPPFISTSFGASMAITQILAALAFAAIAAPALDNKAVRDLGGLLLAVALGLTYIDFMAVLVIWYGDLPKKVSWFVARTHQPWLGLGIAAFALGTALPILALLLAKVRASRLALRAVAASILVGLFLYDGFLLAPVYGVWALAIAFLAMVTIGGALVLLAGFGWPSAFPTRARAAHE